MTDLTQLAVIGVILSLFTQFMKNHFNTHGWETKLVVALLSLILGTTYWFLQDTNVWVNILAILSISSTVYVFLIAPLESKEN